MYVIYLFELRLDIKLLIIYFRDALYAREIFFFYKYIVVAAIPYL